MRVLCISDVHGHADALAAVLATAERHGYGRLLVAGDLCFPGPQPLETWRRLTQAGAMCVQGAGDRALATLDVGGLRPRSDHERARLDRLTQVRAELGELILARLARLPTTFRLALENGDELVLVHGSPVDPLEPFTHDMADEDLATLVGDDPADVIVCGGSHVPFDRTIVVRGRASTGPAATHPSRLRVTPVERRVRIINVGSVGEAPTGLGGAGAHADAALITTHPAGIEVEQLVVPLGKAA